MREKVRREGTRRRERGYLYNSQTLARIHYREPAYLLGPRPARLGRYILAQTRSQSARHSFAFVPSAIEDPTGLTTAYRGILSGFRVFPLYIGKVRNWRRHCKSTLRQAIA